MTVLEVFADIWCPFADVGLHYVAARRSERGRDDVLLDIRAWPLELVNGAPQNAEATAAHVRELRTQVAPHLFGGFDPRHFPTTSLPALALAHAGYRQDAKTGEAISFVLRTALFEQGLDISRPDVLTGIAASLGVGPPGAADDEAVLGDWHDGVRRGVKGSPHFYCGGVDIFCPSLDISRRDDGELVVRNDTAALEGFLGRCFGG